MRATRGWLSRAMARRKGGFFKFIPMVVGTLTIPTGMYPEGPEPVDSIRRSSCQSGGEVLGAPDYFSPEQARAEAELGARSDIFSLGTLLYQLLTGVVPFRADSLQEQIRRICESDPVLPRRINAAIPGDLQDVCMKALEKKPAERYASAREMAEDLERFLAGEKVLANPASYSRLMSGKIELHLRELKGWQQDNILSQYELDSSLRATI